MTTGEQLLYCTVRLEGRTVNGMTSVGTGFLYYSQDRLWVVSNKHVVDQVVEGYLFMHQSAEADEKTLVPASVLRVDFRGSDFRGHDDPDVDLAVANISSIFSGFREKNLYPYHRHVSPEFIPSEATIEQSIGALEEIIFVGYPNGIWDTAHNLPVFRKGITATPYAVDFLNRKQFLIDASVFPGSSGSPVFLFNSGSYPGKSGGLQVGSRLFLLGLISSVYTRKENGEMIVQDVPTAVQSILRVQQMLDLGIVIKADRVEEAAIQAAMAGR